MVANKPNSLIKDCASAVGSQQTDYNPQCSQDTRTNWLQDNNVPQTQIVQASAAQAKFAWCFKWFWQLKISHTKSYKI